MDKGRSQLTPGVVLALAGGVGLLLAEVSWLLAVAVLVLWLGSLWLARPEAAGTIPATDTAGIRQEARRTAIEPVGMPILILAGERIIVANRAARRIMGNHIIGQDARVALRHPDALRLLTMSDGESVTISGFVRARSLWQLTRREIDPQSWLIEMFDRTAEADVSRAHTDFVANASHELRTPLAAIIGYTETLEENGPAVDPPTRDKFLGTVLREARRMQALVSDLMSLSQVEAEKHDLPIETVDLGRLVMQVAGEAAALAGKHRVVATVPAEPVPLRGDRAQLEQMVRNLIDNALKYGDPGEPVRVDLTADEGSGAVLCVIDRGAGIAPDHLPHLTRRFYRADPGRSRASGGTGLGLAIVKHIVERHRGRLDIASTVGTGTTVTVSFRGRAIDSAAVS